MLIIRPQEQEGGASYNVFEAGLLLVTIAGMISLCAKIFEGRRDVLYGPYIQPADQREIC